MSTPPSVQSRKRLLMKQPESQTKKIKEASPQEKHLVTNASTEAVVGAFPPAVQSPEGSKEEVRAEPTGEPMDLRATLQRAQTCAPGSIPAFVAECFHHFETGGAQYSWPFWLKPENLKDIQGLRPADPGYNPSTLWVPDPIHDKAAYQNAQGHNTPMLMQYWKLKSAHFDKVAFFKVGKFYEIFYYDAFIAQRICGFKWMSQDKKPHVGFPEMAKHEYAKQILAAGFKVVVVEQVERVVETNQRKNEGKSQGKQGSAPICVERAPCEIFTSGTLVDPELLEGPGARFLAYLHFDHSPKRLDFALCLVDCATSQIQIGRYTDGPDRNVLRTLLAQVQPSEVVYDVGNLPSEVVNFLRKLPYRPQLSVVRAGECELLAARNRLSKYRAEHAAHAVFNEEVEALLLQDCADSAAIAAAGLMEYLATGLLADRLLPVALWTVLGSSGNAGGGQRMVLDATALSAIEVVETLEGRHDGSLLSFLDHTSTPMGYRLLRQWVCAPLYDLDDIHQRQDAVEFFIQHGDLSHQLRTSLKKCLSGAKIPVDLERATSRIWSYALQAERKAVLYEDVTARRLGQFVELMQAFEMCYNLLTTALPAALPGRLARVARLQKNGGSLPELMPTIVRLKGSLVETSNEKGRVKYRPQDGADAVYDDKCRKIEMVTSELDTELQNVRQRYPKVGFSFMHRLPGYRYEVECDEQAIGSNAKNLDVTYRSKGKLRFYTPKIRELIAQLEHLEDEREDCIFPFLSKLFREFHSHQAAFRTLIRCVAEVDALLSLAFASWNLSGASCKAELVQLDASEPACIELRGCRHPVVASKMGNAFVPNDTLLNSCGVPGILIVTGPNMGGKSTVLRQTCVAVLMAQLGCRVNAEKCKLSPVKRIFTRIGAYDAVLEGKSTLLTELEDMGLPGMVQIPARKETAALLKHGTPRSLAVLDELGRGTATFDGAAIASAVLTELKSHVCCPVLFATHYHPVSKKAVEDTTRVAPFHMAASVNQQTNETTFLYKFLPGLCPASHGHNVAKIAGLPEKVPKNE
ncbi:unnamed protein product [Durusdinium trenchii]|uniref:DNA mismatch repair protein MSH6 (AtMSH6) (MutS protein homolog 6) n=2 Tax=Durusdinium trenchii TaxID=1381693 RepID=A0ABP0LF04_9DINO